MGPPMNTRTAVLPDQEVSPRGVVEVRHLRLIQAIAREGGVTRAAGWLNLTQSALSHQLLNLERDLGARLFDRVGKKMSPTPAGRRLLAAADRVLREIHEAERELVTGLEERTPLRVAAACHTYYSWLAAVLARFGGERPRLDVQVAFQATRRVLEALAADEVDLVITSRPPNDERFAHQELFALEIVALLGAGHDLAAAAKVHWHDLSGQTLLIHDLPDEDVELLRASVRADGQAGASGQVWRVQLTEAIAELARAGHGIGVITRWSAEPLERDPGLALRPLHPRQSRRYWAVWRRSNPRDLPMTALADFLSAEMIRQINEQCTS